MNESIEDDQPPWERPEITRVQPAPDWPDELHQKYFDRAQWILFLARKGYLQPYPDSAAFLLARNGAALHPLSHI